MYGFVEGRRGKPRSIEKRPKAPPTRSITDELMRKARGEDVR